MSELAEEWLNIAFTTNNLTHLNEHFGSCRKIAIYSLSPDSSEQLRTVDFIAIEGDEQNRINDRLSALQGCFAVYCLACSNTLRQQLMARGIHTVIHPNAELIENLISHIQSNWPGKVALRRQRLAARIKDSDYLEKLADSEWDAES